MSIPESRRSLRVRLSLENVAQEEEIAGLLSAHDVPVRTSGAAPTADLAEGDLEAMNVVSWSRLGGLSLEDISRLTSSDDGPHFVVLCEGDDPVTRMRLMAAGVSKVIRSDQRSEWIARLLRMILRSIEQGGCFGPERPRWSSQPKLVDFFSRNPEMKRFLSVVRKVSGSRSSLLITGETGVGKERLARVIHGESPWSKGPFVVVNCGALPEQLLESELFGHEQGAFTGAMGSVRGRFEMADGGTLLLDEIGEMPVHLQVKLLTVLQRGEVRRLGAERSRRVEVRIMAATHRNLPEDIRTGRFREDLYYRLNVIPLCIPPLRERSEDLPDMIGALVRFFRKELLDASATEVSAQALHAMMRHRWPGNMRELINIIERCLLLADGDAVELEDLPREFLETETPGEPEGRLQERSEGTLFERLGVDPTGSGDARLEEVRNHAIHLAESRYLDSLLRDTGGRLRIAAERAGIGPRALYDKMRRYGLRKEAYR